MKFEKHLELEGRHAFLSPSNNAWTNYDEEKLVQRYLNAKAVERGTKLHQFAHDAITLERMLPRIKETLCMYVNDAIMFKMTPEQPLIYSYNCFGTADAISYKRNVLRIHDLKTGDIEAGMKQLYIYAALFCLNYQNKVRELHKKGLTDMDIADQLKVKQSELHFEPEKFDDIVLRIYQFSDYKEEHPDPVDIRALMELIVEHDRIIKGIEAEE